jgi:hypothetical protein
VPRRIRRNVPVSPGIGAVSRFSQGINGALAGSCQKGRTHEAGVDRLTFWHKRKRRGMLPRRLIHLWDNPKNYIPNCTCRLLPFFRLRKRAIAQSGKNFG